MKIVASTPDFYAHDGNAAVERGEGFGCDCARCGRKVAAPFEYQGKLIWCLYCGMEAGHVPLVESEWSHRWTFGVTREECIEDRKALERGEYDEMARARADRYGRVIDFLGSIG